jgi:N-acetylglucosaminyldiphosphoundecaprenol N-acetyl-beta-D-mannosaminyltransferase
MDITTTARSESRPLIRIGGLEIDAVGLDESAHAIVDYCRSAQRNLAGRPVYSTSVNGHVVSMCARDPKLAELFGAADVVNVDGQPLVLLSRLLCRTAAPERVATTDLFPVVARLAEQTGVSFYMLGGDEDANRRAIMQTRAKYPGLRIVGRRNGYFSSSEEPSIVAEIARLKPDVLWVSLGAPIEQRFVARNLGKLRGVGVVKTSGGLFDFLALAKTRAPDWMQRAGLEWLFRLLKEPARLFTRYLVSNPHALLVMVRSMR